MLDSVPALRDVVTRAMVYATRGDCTPDNALSPRRGQGTEGARLATYRAAAYASLVDGGVDKETALAVTGYCGPGALTNAMSQLAILSEQADSIDRVYSEVGEAMACLMDGTPYTPDDTPPAYATMGVIEAAGAVRELIATAETFRARGFDVPEEVRARLREYAETGTLSLKPQG